MVKLSVPDGEAISSSGGMFSLDYLNKVLLSDVVSCSSLEVNVYYDCYVLKTKHGFRVFDTNFNPIDVSFNYRGGVGGSPVPVVKKKDQLSYVENLPEDEGFLGWVGWNDLPSLKERIDFESLESLFFMLPLHNEFGHALTEGLSRFWPLSHKDFEGCEFIFNGVYNYRNESLSDVFWSAFGLAEVFKKKNLSARLPLKSFTVGKVCIPDPGLYLGGVYNSEMRCVWRKIVSWCDSCSSLDNNVKNFSRKVYFSRRKVKKRRCIDEDVLERIFLNNGFDIVFPEDLNFESQVYLASRSDVVAGLSGSALHLCQFMKSNTKLIALTPVFHVMPDLVPVSKINGFDVMYLVGGLESSHLKSLDDGYRFIDKGCTRTFVEEEVKNFIGG